MAADGALEHVELHGAKKSKTDKNGRHFLIEIFRTSLKIFSLHLGGKWAFGDAYFMFAVQKINTTYLGGGHLV